MRGNPPMPCVSRLSNRPNLCSLPNPRARLDTDFVQMRVEAMELAAMLQFDEPSQSAMKSDLRDPPTPNRTNRAVQRRHDVNPSMVTIPAPWGEEPPITLRILPDEQSLRFDRWNHWTPVDVWQLKDGRRHAKPHHHALPHPASTHHPGIRVTRGSGDAKPGRPPRATRRRDGPRLL